MNRLFALAFAALLVEGCNYDYAHPMTEQEIEERDAERGIETFTLKDTKFYCVKAIIQGEKCIVCQSDFRSSGVTMQCKFHAQPNDRVSGN